MISVRKNFITQSYWFDTRPVPVCSQLQVLQLFLPLQVLDRRKAKVWSKEKIRFAKGNSSKVRGGFLGESAASSFFNAMLVLVRRICERPFYQILKK